MQGSLAPRRATFRLRVSAAVAAAIIAAGVAEEAAAWGLSHPAITRHALRSLPPSDRAEARLGGLRQMDDLCWGGDYQGEVHAQWYVDDYLVFPGFPRQSSHLMPDVSRTWAPFFRRTLQALRTESPANAARWLGSFLHFVQDSGSPPHALPTGGQLHSRMENYIFDFQVRLPDYAPRRLGATDEEAERELLRRMEGLVAFSRERAERMLPAAQRDDRAACEPLALECALETARVTADVAHTLFVLSEAGAAQDSGTVSGTVEAPGDPELPLLPAKLMVEGSGLATVSESAARDVRSGGYRGAFTLGGLPPGDHTLIVARTGCRTLRRRVRVRKGRTTRLVLRLEADAAPGNRIRNPDLSVRWLGREAPDHWTRVPEGWRSDAFPVTPGTEYEISARDGAGSRPVEVRESDDPRMPATRLPLDQAGRAVPRRRYAALVVRGEGLPEHAAARPSVRLTPPKGPSVGVASLD